MDNTFENKAKFFVQYWGQHVIFNRIKGTGFHPVLGFPVEHNSVMNNCHLHLKPLSVLTDEEALSLAKLLSPSNDCEYKVSKGYVDNGIDSPFEDIVCVETKVFIKHPLAEKYYLSNLLMIDTSDGEILKVEFSNDGEDHCDAPCENILEMYDILRFNGYAIPFMGLSVETMVKYGWIRFEMI